VLRHLTGLVDSNSMARKRLFRRAQPVQPAEDRPGTPYFEMRRIVPRGAHKIDNEGT